MKIKYKLKNQQQVVYFYSDGNQYFQRKLNLKKKKTNKTSLFIICEIVVNWINYFLFCLSFLIVNLCLLKIIFELQ